VRAVGIAKISGSERCLAEISKILVIYQMVNSIQSGAGTANYQRDISGKNSGGSAETQR
jgi:hypothetical protein